MFCNKEGQNGNIVQSLEETGKSVVVIKKKTRTVLSESLDNFQKEIHKTLCCGYSLESSGPGNSN